MRKQRIRFIVGPTAVGKSSFALKAAQKLDGEIISADSMQVYREINIASNKPSSDELNLVRHYLVDCVSVEDEFDVNQFSCFAHQALDEIVNRNKIPIVCGGSGLYVNVLLDGLFEGKASDENLRQDLFEQAQRFGYEKLHQKLMGLDPASAQMIHPNNVKRVVRAIEICVFSTSHKFLLALPA